MPRVERVEANDIEGLRRQRSLVVLQHLEHVLIMSPTQCQILETSARLVYAKLGVVLRIITIWISDEALVAIYDVVAPSTANHERVANCRPLRFA